jgi:Signal transduction histidine kinase
MYNRIRQNNRQIVEAELEKEREQRLNKMNMSFFTNISHEFRTPLTMIAGPITQLCDKPEITGDNKQLLYIVQRSVNSMLKLVNQLMDFNKLDNDSLKLSVKRTDLIFELNRLVEVFRVNMQNKNILLQTYGLEDTYLTWLDVDKLDKVIGNLMSNALKFTDKDGRIKLSFDVINRDKAAELFHLTDKDVSAEYTKITITDSGCGIPQNELEKIFERYYQLNNQATGKYNWGTGIGLYYTRRLVELHHGHIKADSKIGEGSTFTCILPVGDAAYKEGERQSHMDRQEEV